MWLDERRWNLIEMLLALPDAKQGRHSNGGVSTKCIQWIIAYMIDAQTGDIVEEAETRDVGRGRKRGRQARNDSFRQLSIYMGFSPGFYNSCVKKMLMRNKSEISTALGWKGGVRNEVK